MPFMISTWRKQLIMFWFINILKKLLLCCHGSKCIMLCDNLAILTSSKGLNWGSCILSILKSSMLFQMCI